MNEIKYEWDERKSITNKIKHGVTFEEAITVFEDADALVISDPDHSIDEERFIILGISNVARVLVVCHCYRQSDFVIRIISARKATKSERNQYNRRK